MPVELTTLSLENPVFHTYLIAAGFLFVLVGPPLLLAQILIWTYVGARAAHFIAYSTAQLHDVRATFWTFSSLPVIVMAGYVLMRAV